MIDPQQQAVQGPAVATAGPSGPASSSPLPTMPAGLGPPPRQPSIQPVALPHITPDTPDEQLPKEPRLADLQNLFERRGLLLAQEIEARAQRISQAMQQPPTNSVKLNDQQIQAYWDLSPNGPDRTANDARFWEVHDQVLVQTGDPAQAEQKAMQQVYPVRAMMVGMGLADPERQVQMAEHIRKVVDGDLKPDSEITARAHHSANEDVTGGGY